jgi:hypothetical protein
MLQLAATCTNLLLHGDKFAETCKNITARCTHRQEHLESCGNMYEKRHSNPGGITNF